MAFMLVAATAGAGAVGPGDETVTSAGELAFEDASAGVQVPEMKEGTSGGSGFTKAVHRMEWGASHEAFETYENDNGDVIQPAESDYWVNTTPDNPYSLTFTHVEEDDYGAFPRVSDESDNSASFLDASEHEATAGTNSSELTVEDTTVVDGVDAIRYNTGTNFESGAVAHSNFTANVSIDSDETKRVIMVGMDADTLESGSKGYINITDEGGDYVSVKFGAAFTQSDHDVIAASTGDGYVLQEKVSNLTVEGSGDGTIDNIEHVNVTVKDGDVDVSISWFDLEKKGKVTLAKEKKDTDDDDDLETVEHEDVTGAVSTYSLETLPSMYDDAVMHDVTAPVYWGGKKIDSEDVHIVANESDKYTFGMVVTAFYRINVPAQIDFTHSQLSLVDDVEWPAGRYIDSGVIEDADSTKDIDEFSMSDLSSPSTAYGDSSEGEEITLDSSISTDQDYVIGIKLNLKPSEWDAWTSPSGSGAAVAVSDGGGGGPIDALWTFVIGILGAVAAWKRKAIAAVLGR